MSDLSGVLTRPRTRASGALALAVWTVLALVGAFAVPAAAAPSRTRSTGDGLAGLAVTWRDAQAAVTLDRLALGAAQDDLTAKQAAYDAIIGTVAANGPTRRLDPRDGVVVSGGLFDLRSVALAARDDAALAVAVRAAALLDDVSRASHAEDAVVAEVAERGHVDSAGLRAGWDATPDRALDVIAFTLAQAGKPYVFAAAGPDAYDCSGLTMAAWATQGVHLAHFAATQYAETSRVRPADLRPGDLVFFGDDLGHVGLYVGEHLMVHAPHTGDVVRVASVGGRDAMRTGRVDPSD